MVNLFKYFTILLFLSNFFSVFFLSFDFFQKNLFFKFKKLLDR
ncbi:hypothetical protein HMPREF9071_0510 [Capnocytophaga sp. oral taxon 338 str. F0234]|nr:hypothetical protein HMPREF9071_0510 [Capnocytophaga sp. oral taxon 338 str. F0234]